MLGSAACALYRMIPRLQRCILNNRILTIPNQTGANDLAADVLTRALAGRALILPGLFRVRGSPPTPMLPSLFRVRSTPLAFSFPILLRICGSVLSAALTAPFSHLLQVRTRHSRA